MKADQSNESNVSPDLDLIAKALIEYESLSGDEIKDILRGKKIDKKDLDKLINKDTKKSKIKSSVPANSGRIKPKTQPST